MWPRPRLPALLAIAALASGCPSLAGFGGGVLDGSTSDATTSDAPSDDGGGDDAGSPFQIVHQEADGGTLLAVWGADSTHIFAGGTDELDAIYDGNSWTFAQPVPGIDVHGIWGASPSNVFRCGANRGTGTGFIDHFNGQMWTSVYTTPEPLYAVWGTGGSNGDAVIFAGARGNMVSYVVGSGFKSFFEYDGSLPVNAEAPPDPNAPVGWGISGLIAPDRSGVLYEVAGGVNTFYFIDQANLELYNLKGNDLRAVWQAPWPQIRTYFGANFFSGLLVVQNLDASLDLDAVVDPIVSLWQLVGDYSDPSNANRYLYGIWGDSTRALFVGDQGRIYETQIDPNTNLQSSYTRLVSPTTVGLRSIWGASPQDVWIVGEQATILHGSMP